MVKLGQKLMVGFWGTKPGDEEVEKICQYLQNGLIGGVIFFGYNIVSPEQTRKLTQHFRDAATSPIWIAVDQEGGRVQRLKAKQGFTDYRCPYQVAESMSPAEAYTYYRELAGELAEIGFNLNLGCVLDMHSLPGEKSSTSPVIGQLYRSFGSDPNTIVAYASSFVYAHKDKGVTVCLKHYPGHGLAKKDSHKGMVDITQTHLSIEREPFRRMIQKGLADMIMSAHLMYRKLDDVYPVSLSEKILKKWLREEDGFKELVITDDLHMGAIGQHFDIATVIIQALNAGNDILIFSNNKTAAQNVKDFKPDQDLPLLFQEIVEKGISDNSLRL